MLVSPEFFRHFSYNLRAVPGSETGSMSLLGNIGHQEITADASASGSSGVGKATSGTFTRVFARVQGGRTVTCRLHWLLGGTWWATFLMRLMKRIQWIWGCNPFFQKGHTHIYVCMYIWLYIYNTDACTHFSILDWFPSPNRSWWLGWYTRSQSSEISHSWQKIDILKRDKELG
jgi:hypothetical protein